jgi:hypothetical protein
VRTAVDQSDELAAVQGALRRSLLSAVASLPQVPSSGGYEIARALASFAVGGTGTTCDLPAANAAVARALLDMCAVSTDADLVTLADAAAAWLGCVTARVPTVSPRPPPTAHAESDVQMARQELLARVRNARD